MTLLDRDDELEILFGLLDECRQGHGRVAVVCGGVATGKTALLRTFADQAAELGALPLIASCSAVERTMPLSAMAQLFHGRNFPGHIAERVANLLVHPAAAGADSGSEYEPIEGVHVGVIHDLCAVLLELAESTPLLIGVDDIHYSDKLSLQCLSYLVRRFTAARVLVVLNESNAVPPEYPALRTDLCRQPQCRRLRLDRLSRHSVTRLLAEHLGRAVAEQLSATCWARTGGNPLLVRAYIEDRHPTDSSAPAQQVSDTATAGEAFTEAVLACLHRCEPETRVFAQALAVLGDSGSRNLLGKLLGREAESLALPIRALTASGLLESGRLRHAAIQSVVLDDMAPQQRTEMRLRAAELLRNEGAATTTVAEQLIAASRADGEWAVNVLQDAATQAMDDHNQVEMAVQCLNLAYHDCPDEHERGKITAALARIEWRIDPAAARRHFPRLITAIRDGHLRAYDAVTTVKHLLWHGRTDEAETSLETLFGTAHRADAETVAELRVFRRWLAHSQPPLLERIDALAAGPDDATAEDNQSNCSALSAEPRLQVTTLLGNVFQHGPDSGVVPGAEHVLRNYRRKEAGLDSVVGALTVLMYSDRLDLAASWCRHVLRNARESRHQTYLAILSSLYADIAYRNGDLPAAQRHAQQALTQMSADSWGVGIGSPLASLLLATTAMGAHQEAATQLNQPVPEAMFQTRYGLHYLHARGHYYLAVNQLQAALRDFEECGDLMQKWGIDLPAFVPWRTDVAQTYLREGLPNRAGTLIEEQLALLGDTPSRARGVALRLLAATVQPKHRLELLRDAVDVLQDCGNRLELSRALVDLSSAHHSLGDAHRARMVMRRACYVAAACRAELVRPKTAPDGGGPEPETRAEGGTEGIATLTNAERRVAALAAQGYTNREVALKLFISVSTVEQHLSRVYRKLRVNRRADLPGVLKLNVVHTA